MFGQSERRSRSSVCVCSSQVLVHIHILSICRRGDTICLQTSRRRRLLPVAVGRGLGANSGALPVVSTCGRGGAQPGLSRLRVLRRKSCVASVPAVLRLSAVCSIADVFVAAPSRRTAAVRVVRVRGGRAAFGALAPLSQSGHAAVRTRRGLQGRLGH